MFCRRVFYFSNNFSCNKYVILAIKSKMFSKQVLFERYFCDRKLKIFKITLKLKIIKNLSIKIQFPCNFSIFLKSKYEKGLGQGSTLKTFNVFPPKDQKSS